MSFEVIARSFLYAGSIVLIIGIVSLTILQSKLIGRIDKSLFTFLSVMFYPDNELTENEKIIKKYGSYITLVGGLVVLVSGFFLWLII